MGDPTSGTAFDLAHLCDCDDGDVANLDTAGGDEWMSVAVDRADAPGSVHASTPIVATDALLGVQGELLEAIDKHLIFMVTGPNGSGKKARARPRTAGDDH